MRLRTLTSDVLVKKSKKNAQLTVAEANRTYFVILGTTRASLGTLGGLAFLILFLLGLMNVSMFAKLEGYGIFSYILSAHVVMIWICSGLIVLSVFKRLIYRFQVFFSWVMTGLALGLVYSLCMLTLPLAVYPPGGDGRLVVTPFNVAGVCTVLLLAGATVVHVMLLRHRLRVGHSQNRTIGNLVAVSGSNRGRIFWITFGLVLVVPNVLTLGQYVLNSIGAIALLVFACVMTSLPVEFAYLAFLKSKDRIYWEGRPRPMPRRERIRLAKKVCLWLVIVVVAVGLFWVLAKFVRF